MIYLLSNDSCSGQQVNIKSTDIVFLLHAMKPCIYGEHRLACNFMHPWPRLFRLQPLSGIHRIGSCVGLRACLKVSEDKKVPCLYRDSNPDPLNLKERNIAKY